MSSIERVLLKVISRSLISSSLFFHAEDGIRDRDVTGVQTCALPISERVSCWRGRYDGGDERVVQRSGDALGIDTGAEIVFAEREVGSGLLHAAREDEDRRGASRNGITKFLPRVVFKKDAGGTLGGARGGREDEAHADESKKSRSERRCLLGGGERRRYGQR